MIKKDYSYNHAAYSDASGFLFRRNTGQFMRNYTAWKLQMGLKAEHPLLR